MPVVGKLFGTSSKSTCDKHSATALAAHLKYMPVNHLDTPVSLELGLSADGDFELVIRFGKDGTPRSLAKGNARRLAADARRSEKK